MFVSSSLPFPLSLFIFLFFSIFYIFFVFFSPESFGPASGMLSSVLSSAHHTSKPPGTNFFFLFFAFSLSLSPSLWARNKSEKFFLGFFSRERERGKAQNESESDNLYV